MFDFFSSCFIDEIYIGKPYKNQNANPLRLTIFKIFLVYKFKEIADNSL